MNENSSQITGWSNILILLGHQKHKTKYIGMIFYDAHNNYSQVLLLYRLPYSRIAELCLVGKNPESLGMTVGKSPRHAQNPLLGE